MVAYLAYVGSSWIAYWGAEQIVGVTKEASSRAALSLKLDPSKFTVIYNPIECDSVGTSEQGAKTAWEPIHISRDTTLLAVGRLTHQKGFDVLIEAVRLLRERGWKCRAVIVGKGPDLPDLRSLTQRSGVGESVDFVGYREDPWQWTRKPDAFVLPSRWEGIANSLIEALCCRLRVVASDCPAGPREILDAETGLLGTLVKPESAMQLADGIETEVGYDEAKRGALWREDVGRQLAAFQPDCVAERWRAVLG